MSEIIADILYETVIKSDFKESRAKFVPSEKIEKEIADLTNCTIEELQQKWKNISNAPVPKWNRSFFIPRLANQLQKIYYNRDISAETKEKLAELYSKPEYAIPEKRSKKQRTIQAPKLFKVGQVVHIQMKNKAESFTVVNDGYLFNGKVYKYIKNLLKAMTGTDIKLKDLEIVGK